MVGPLSGDEAVAVANWAKAHPTKTFIIGTAGSQDPTLQIAPKNVFRYHGDGAQWNAGIGEIALQEARLAEGRDHHGRLQLRLDVRGRHHRRLLRDRRRDHEARVPAAEHDRLLVRTSGSCRRRARWTGTSGSSAAPAPAPALKAFEQAYGTIKPEQHSGNLFLWFLTASRTSHRA